MRLPAATYRLQLRKEFNLRRAARLVPYLHRLGITDLYLSPLWKARAGSPHGYDVVDHSRLNPELGTERDLERLAGALKKRGMGLVADVVPNHMAINDPENAWWWDLLENGPGSPFARCFDVDWSPLKVDLAEKVLLPVLEDQYGRVLEKGKIQVVCERGIFVTVYGSHRFPVAPRSWKGILEPALESLRRRKGAVPADVLEMESLLTALSHLPLRTETAPERVRERRREMEVIRGRLRTLMGRSAGVRREIGSSLRDLNGRRWNPASFRRLEALLDEQVYRLCNWRVAADEVNYRRFFDVNELAAIRVEDPEVFEQVHRKVFEWVRKGWVTGLRVDHVDGLFDPWDYLHAIRGRVGPLYVVVEKILGHEEKLHPEWPVQGTTGYDFLNDLNGLFVDPGRRTEFRSLYGRVAGPTARFEDLVRTCKKLILLVSMASELQVLAWQLDRISEQHRWSRDFTLESLRFALREVIACFPVYRSYLRGGDPRVSPEDRARILFAVREAKRWNPATSESLFEFIGDVLLRRDPPGLEEEQKARRRAFTMRFQQLTGPVMAKAFEDTAFYRAYPLASLNEVGGDPSKFGLSVEEFHRRNGERARSSPSGLLATTTHDTKRGEDVRARLNALSEIPEEWERAVVRWAGLNRGRKFRIGGREAPDRNEEYLLYQTMVGTLPLEPLTPSGRRRYIQRIQGYMEKAFREAKIHTSWIRPDLAREAATARFIQDLLTPGRRNRFPAELEAFTGRVARWGAWNGLSQVTLKIASPGVPDFYQGAELWDLRLVDPDNRGPVDFGRRARMLSLLEKERGPGAQVARWADGAVKLQVTRKGLLFRRRHMDLFLEGEYVPLRGSGPKAGHVCAFGRRLGRRWALAVVPVRVASLVPSGAAPVGERVWGETLLRLPPTAPRRWENVFRGGQVRAARGRPGLSLAALLEDFPVALLSGITEGRGSARASVAGRRKR